MLPFTFPVCGFMIITKGYQVCQNLVFLFLFLAHADCRVKASQLSLFLQFVWFLIIILLILHFRDSSQYPHIDFYYYEQ